MRCWVWQFPAYHLRWALGRQGAWEQREAGSSHPSLDSALMAKGDRCICAVLMCLRNLGSVEGGGMLEKT